MPKSYRIRTQPGVDKSIRVKVEQDFDFLEVLSLKIRQEDVYTRFCADYGVVVGRVIANSGFGVPNARISVFVPLDELDAQDPVISVLYPYTSTSTKNEDGFRYNLLPYVPSYDGHVATGSFPTRNDVLTRQEVLEVYEKYYKFTTKTNDSGDFMIVGVPLGIQQVFLDLDLSDMGCFSLRPNDLIRAGLGVEEQFDGNNFLSSTDLNSLPQVISSAVDVDVASFWGVEDVCDIGITRIDFDLADLGIKIEPTAVFMGSIFSNNDRTSLQKNCKPRTEQGDLCGLTTGPGTIQAIRQTIDFDANGNPVLEEYKLENGGKVIDENGTFLIDVPMNMDYVTTNEFGETVLSNDPSVGIPTTAKYRFKMKYQSEESAIETPLTPFPNIAGSVQRANFLVPQIREYGWTGTSINPGIDPASFATDTSPNYNPNYTANTQWQLFNKSYAFSLNWNDYPDVPAAIACEDFFYKFKYNKVYTTSQLIDEYRKGTGRARFIGIKEILDRGCESETNKFPVTDGVRNFDFLFFLFDILITLLTPVFFSLIIVGHVICFLWPLLRLVLGGLLTVLVSTIRLLCIAVRFLSFGLLKLNCPATRIIRLPKACPLSQIPLPNLSYPDCQACDCESREAGQAEDSETNELGNTSLLANTNQYAFFEQLIAVDSGGDVKETWMSKYQYGFQSSMSGFDDGETNSDFTKAPFMDDNSDNGNPFTSLKTWSLDLPLSERMNLFNVKAKSHTNGSFNQVRTYVNPTLNSNNYHFDNVMMLLCDPGVETYVPSGQILSFQNPDVSVDPNLSGGTTGFTSTGNFSASVTYMDLSSPSLASATKVYTITGSTDGTTLLPSGQRVKNYNFPSDIEYYQVITATTVNDFLTTSVALGGGSYQAPTEAGYAAGPNNTFLQRFLFGYQRIKRFGSTTNDPHYYPDDNTTGAGDTGKFKFNGPNLLLNNDYKNHVVVFLVRGVDMYTDRQDIEYDLSRLYNKSYGTGPRVRGNFKMNVPIQPYSSTTNYRLPRHNSLANNGDTQNGFLFFGSYSFTVGSNYQSYNTKNHLYYSALDTSNTKLGTSNNSSYSGDFAVINGAVATKSSSSWNKMINIGSPVTDFENGYYANEIVEGGTVIMANSSSSPARSNYRYFSPTYFTQYPTDVLPMTNTARIIMRSERLPSSDVTDRRFVLHQNANFATYILSDLGQASLATAVYNTGIDGDNDLSDDLAEDGGTVSQRILATFSCEGMVPLNCYTGNGETIGVAIDSDDCYYVGDKDKGVRKMSGGCYYLLQRNFFIGADISMFIEWRSRFRMMFALCRNVVSLTFVNNWINGGLYMYSFFKDDLYLEPLSSTTYNSKPTYRFCRDNIVFGEVNNQLFYRASPYNTVTGDFTGKRAPVRNSGLPYEASNLRLLGSPTTLIDLGPKDIIIGNVCTSAEFDGYVMDRIPSTSHKPTDDLLQLFVISRISNSGFWRQLFNSGNSSIGQLFSRSKQRLDGDVAQLLSINSELGVTPFLGDNYSEQDVKYLDTATGPVLGVFFSANTITRDYVTPGRVTFQDNTISYLTNYYGFEDQEVPFQPWKVQPTAGNIFGNELNDWNTKNSTNVVSINYQSVDRLLGNPTFPSEVSTPTTQRPGYIYNSSSTGGLNPTITPKLTLSPMPNYLMTGAPYFFYFGLKIGATAMNRFITKYIAQD